MPDESHEYLSVDSISKVDANYDGLSELIYVEYLNTINCSGLPNHIIVMKVVCMVMLLRNIDQANELCNGTRLIVTTLGKHFIEAKTIFGMNPDTKVFRPRMLQIGRASCRERVCQYV